MAEHHLTCRGCGKQFLRCGAQGKSPRICPKCRAQAKSRACKGCGQVIGKGKQLCPDCAAARRALREAARAAASRSPAWVPAGDVRFRCAYCGQDAVRYYRGSGVVPTLCGSSCKKAAYNKRHGVLTVAEREEVAARFRVVHRVTIRPRQGPPEPRRCGCGAFVYVKGARKCQPCRLRRPASKDAARKARKLTERGVRTEMVDARQVLARDGWRCQLCGVKTPPRYRGSFRPNAPEVDHIIPIACGGEHSYRNTQCACRQCNLAKRDSPMGQMRLF